MTRLIVPTPQERQESFQKFCNVVPFKVIKELNCYVFVAAVDEALDDFFAHPEKPAVGIYICNNKKVHLVDTTRLNLEQHKLFNEVKFEETKVPNVYMVVTTDVASICKKVNALVKEDYKVHDFN